MSEKHVVVDGATCKCTQSEKPDTDILVVKSQSKHFANDNVAEKQLIASTKEIGQTLKKNTFGNCKLQPRGGGTYNICVASIKEWKGSYKKITLSNQGTILLEDSKATCATMSIPDCIEVTKHGQKAEVSKQQIQKADPDILKQINPLLSSDDIEDEDSDCK